MSYVGTLAKEVLLKLGESLIYKRGFASGRNGEPREIWRYDTEEARSLYNQGYEDGREAARLGLGQ